MRQHLTVVHDLPEGDAKAEYVAFGGELSLEDALVAHPADGQHFIVVFLLVLANKGAIVANLHLHIGGVDEAIPRC